MPLTREALATALLNVGREVTDDDVAVFSAIAPTDPGANLAVTLAIRARFDRPIPPPQVHRVMAALLEASG